MSSNYDERSHLLHLDASLHTLPYDLPSSSPTPINATPGPRQERSETQQSAISLGGLSILGSEASPKDVQELLDNLDRATRLIRNHLQEDPERGEHVPVSRPLIPRWVTSYLIIITFIWQVISVGFLELVDAIKTSNSTEDGDVKLASNVIMTVFQAANLLLVFLVSYKLVKKVLHRTASGSLLAQSYLSTVLLFAGLYTLEYRFSSKSFINVFDHTGMVFTEAGTKKPTLLFLRMLYFSVSTATLCGTSEVEPVQWYASITVSLQMLMSFVYFASILSLGMIPRKQDKNTPQIGRKSLTQKLRDWIFRNRTS